MSMPRPFEVRAVKDQRLRGGLVESLVSKYWLGGGGKDLVVRNSRLDSARLLAIALTPYVRELHGKALTGIRRLSEVKGVINALINGELHRLVELSQLMGVEHGRARELLDKALGNRARELMPKHMRDRQVRELARGGDVKLIIDALHNLRGGGVSIGRDVLKPLLEAFRDDARAVEVINNWWVRHVDRLNKALSSGASNEELILINRLSVRELTRALAPFVNAKYREALESRAWGGPPLRRPYQWLLASFSGMLIMEGGLGSRSGGGLWSLGGLWGGSMVGCLGMVLMRWLVISHLVRYSPPGLPRLRGVTSL